MARSREFAYRLVLNDTAQGRRVSVRASLAAIGSTSVLLWIVVITAFRLLAQ
jgi:hypothetical protein